MVVERSDEAVAGLRGRAAQAGDRPFVAINDMLSVGHLTADDGADEASLRTYPVLIASHVERDPPVIHARHPRGEHLLVMRPRVSDISWC